MLAKFDKTYNVNFEKDSINDIIKVANSNDSRKIYEFYKNNTNFNYTMEKISSKLENNKNRIYFYEENNCIVSIVQIKNEEKFNLLTGCATHVNFRKRGYARILLEYVCNKNSEKDIFLTYNREKEYLKTFYNKVNFKNIVEMEFGKYDGEKYNKTEN